MNFSQDIKILNGEGFKVLFDKRDLTLRLVPNELKGLISRSSDKAPMLPELRPIIHNVSGAENCYGQSREKHCSKDNDRRPSLQRLTMNVSNICNMACKYCYANQGTYNTNGMLMDKHVALDSINYFIKHFSRIHHVNFFGGEPTLNAPIIEMVCEYFYYLKARHVISYVPKFGLTTNCYRISDKFIDLLHKYEFSLTVSIDGPKEIHDRLRVDTKNLGTYDVIEKNIFRIINSGIIPEFECTYTLDHLKIGIDIINLMDYFYEKFKCTTLHCPMVLSRYDDESSVPLHIAESLYCDAINYSVENLDKGVAKSISVATRLINSLSSKTDICHYCPAGHSSLTVNADGSINACFMLFNDSNFNYGNIYSPVRPAPGKKAEHIIKNCDKKNNPSCRKCWIQPLCFGCLAEDLNRPEMGHHKSSVAGESDLCDYKRKLVKSFLLSTVTLFEWQSKNQPIQHLSS